jgi:hypothetical protein
MEQIFLNLIGDFVGGRLVCRYGVENQEFWRLRVFVNKRRQLGKIYVELSNDNWEGVWTVKKPWRMYLTSFWWEPVWNEVMMRAIDHLSLLRHRIHSQVSTTALAQQIAKCKLSVENYNLRKSSR